MKNVRLDQRIAAIAALQHAVFSRAQATMAGASREAIRWRVRTGVWIQLARDVFRLAGAPDTWESRLWAASLEAGPGAAVSHRSAAALLGIPGFEPGPVHVLRKGGRHHAITLGTVHESFWLPPGHIRVVRGLRTTSLARTLVDLAADEHPKRVERAVDNSLSRLGLTMPALADVVSVMARRGRAGSPLMRRIVKERGPGYRPTESGLEDLFLDVLRRYGVPPPERQVNVGSEERFIGRVDYRYPGSPTVIEVNGRPYHESLLDLEADAVRTSELAVTGRPVVVVTRRQLDETPADVARRVRAVHRQAAAALADPDAQAGVRAPASAKQT